MMAFARKVELATGLAAVPLGVAGLLYAVFGPTGRYESHTFAASGALISSESGWTNLWHEGISGTTVAFLLAVLVLLVAVGLGAWLHAGRAVPSALVLLWCGSVVLALAAFVTGLTIGLFVFPAAMLALVAAAAGSMSRRWPAPAGGH